jgi:histidine triad (HIT) family protein
MTNYTGSDIYCDLIVPRKIDVKVIKETDNVLAFYHTKPHWPVHIVVVPKKHIDSLLTLDLDADISKELLSTVKEMAAMVTKEQGSCRVLTNLGSYQDSKHLHLHISSGSPLVHKD